MPQHPIEIILLQQWASMMSVPIWITDASGDLVYFNEATEALIGVRFEDGDSLSAGDLAARFEISDVDGNDLPRHERPLLIALEKQQPAQRHIRIRTADGASKVIADTAIPIVGEANRPLGAMVLLWDSGEDHT